MDRNNRYDKNDDVVEIDLQRMFGALLSRAWIMAVAAVLCALVAFFGTLYFIAPQYESKAKFYVNNSSLSSFSDMTLSSLTASDISASRGLVQTYIVILQTRETINDVIDYAGVDRSYSEVKRMVSAASVNDTEIFEVVVTSTDPEEAEKLANAVAYILPNRIKNIIDGTSAKVVEAAVVASKPSSPSYTKNTILGFVIGLLLTAAVIVIKELMDITIRTEEDIAHSCDYPVLAAVPDMELQSKGGRYYGYGYGQGKSPTGRNGKQPVLVGGEISFAAAEAYKLLRTKLQFSFVDEGECHVVGVSSALTGEGKSLSAVNLAYSLSQIGKGVLLIDCDMRRPSVADKLPVQKYPGLSEFLTGQTDADKLIQFCGVHNDESAFHIISAGRMPPNPMELLSSRKMEKMMSKLREKYDYIILDLPPVGEVGDALAAAKLTDGMLLVVRENYCDRISLSNTLDQFKFMDARILGVVFNCTADNGVGYGKRYYKKYDSRYSRAYQKSTYAAASKAHSKAEDK